VLKFDRTIERKKNIKIYGRKLPKKNEDPVYKDQNKTVDRKKETQTEEEQRTKGAGRE